MPILFAGPLLYPGFSSLQPKSLRCVMLSRDFQGFRGREPGTDAKGEGTKASPNIARHDVDFTWGGVFEVGM